MHTLKANPFPTIASERVCIRNKGNNIYRKTTRTKESRKGREYAEKTKEKEKEGKEIITQRQKKRELI
jgi:hypothetical protein